MSINALCAVLTQNSKLKIYMWLLQGDKDFWSFKDIVAGMRESTAGIGVGSILNNWHKLLDKDATNWN